jgi:hypothetical protein
MRGEMFDHILSLSIEPLFGMCCQLECMFPIKVCCAHLRCSLAAFLSSLYTALVARELLGGVHFRLIVLYESSRVSG